MAQKFVYYFNHFFNTDSHHRILTCFFYFPLILLARTLLILNHFRGLDCGVLLWNLAYFGSKKIKINSQLTYNMIFFCIMFQISREKRWAWNFLFLIYAKIFIFCLLLGNWIYISFYHAKQFPTKKCFGYTLITLHHVLRNRDKICSILSDGFC